jgi:hypothetical protein
VSTDTASDSTTDACPGSAGCDCKDNGDCDSGICIDNANSANPSGKECAQTCVDSCEAGYKCATTSIGGEPVAVCVPAKGNLCHPCSASKDCKAVGQTDHDVLDQAP